MRFFIYLRKSSESEDRQALSIEAQEDEVAKAATRDDLLIVGEPYREAHSARMSGTRELFTEMMKRLRAGEADAILCWHLNRLARNMREAGEIIDDLSNGVIKEIRTPHEVYKPGNSTTQLIAAFQFAMATKYSKDLSADVTRGNKKWLSLGFWTGKPKLGYVRDPEPDAKKLIRDTDRFDVVSEALHMVLAGDRPADVYRFVTNVRLLRTPRSRRKSAKRAGGRALSRSAFYKLLKDPFYAGLMLRGGETYRGNHEPMITMGEHERIKDLLRDRARTGDRRQALEFTYRGMITCGRCGGLCSGRISVQRHGHVYIHYGCSRKNRKFRYCPEGVVQEHQIEAQIIAWLERCRIPDSFVEFALAQCERIVDEVDGQREKVKGRTAGLLKEVEARRSALTRLLVDGVVEKQDYQAELSRLAIEQQKLREKAKNDEGADGLIKPVQDLIFWLNKAPENFRQAPAWQKQQMVKSLSLNLMLRDKILLISAENPLPFLPKSTSCPLMSTGEDTVETLRFTPTTKEMLEAVSHWKRCLKEMPPSTHAEGGDLLGHVRQAGVRTHRATSVR